MGQAFVKGERCPISDPANPHTLSHGVGANIPSGCFKCGEQNDGSGKDYHYRCITCNVEFHNQCQLYPRKIRHPYHFQHPLTLIESYNETGIFKNCNWCGKDLDNPFYRCSVCGFCLDRACSRTSPSLTITNPKSHQHPLVFFPRPFSLPCDACGLVDISRPAYTCLQCNYMVHQSCIYLPREIKITRHPHRLSYTPSFLPEVSTCQICYKTVDTKYGQYSCYHEGCSYLAHSKCATHAHVWDGNELEWEPEKTNEGDEDIAPFEKVGVDLIKYFCHEHHLKLQRYDNVRDADKQCQACVFPIDSRDNFYNCTQCDFFLHEECASLPRKMDHALHRHPLVLEPSPLVENIMKCSTCGRHISGFRSGESGDVGTCKGCFSNHQFRLHCTLCDFVLCYYCATIPTEVYYKYDEHPLFLCYGEVNDDTYWCDVCEKKLDPAEWFYTCTTCCITIHRECIFGSSVYMQYGYTFNDNSRQVEVVRNNSNTRPICINVTTAAPISYTTSCKMDLFVL